MNALSRWNPFREMDDMQRRMSSLLELSPFRRNSLTSDEENISVPEWAPLVDIAEDSNGYLIKVELPGVDKKDVRVSVEKGVLSISGDRHQEHDEKKGKIHRIERSYGAFRRSFSVPEDADSAKIAADYKNGILTLHLPKVPETQPKQIEIKVS